MDNKPQNRYSVIALYVSLAAVIASIVAGAASYFISTGALTVTYGQTIKLALQISAALIPIGLAVYAILEPDMVRRFLSGRQARYGSNAFVTILAFVGIVFVVNYMVATNTQLVAIHKDLTENKVNTLSPEMIQAMQTLPGQLTATDFSTQTDDTARTLFDKMRAESNGLFDYSFVNPDKNPGAAKDAGITGDGKILLEMNGRREIAEYADESTILTAYNRILNPEERTVYFLTGHQEHDVEGSGDNPMTRVKDILEKKNITVKTLNLIAENAIPSDAKAIVIAGPQIPLSSKEVDLLNTFAINGGGLVVMEDVTPLTNFGDAADPLAEMLSNTWGLTLRNDFVVDPANGSAFSNAVGSFFDNNSTITRSFVNQVVIMPLTRSIDVGTPDGFITTSLVQTTPGAGSQTAWGETDFTPLVSNASSPAFDPTTDALGPLTLAASSTKSDGGVAIVFGTSNFATDQNFDAYGNGDLLVNAISYAAGEGNTVDVTPKDTSTRTYLPASQGVSLLTYIGVICLLPGLAIGGGIYTWAARRRRG